MEVRSFCLADFTTHIYPPHASLHFLFKDAAKDLNSPSIILYILPVSVVLGLLLVIIPVAMSTEKGKGKHIWFFASYMFSFLFLMQYINLCARFSVEDIKLRGHDLFP